MKPLLLSAALLAASATSAVAEPAKKTPELSAPIVMLTPLVAQNAEALALTEAQRADLKDWMASMPAKRKAVEAEALQARAALRAAILSGAPQETRAELAQNVGAYETKLVLLRSACADHWRATLSAEQFAQLVGLASAKM